MKRLIGLCAWLVWLPAFGADAVSEIKLRSNATDSAVLKVPAPSGTASLCREDTQLWDTLQVDLTRQGVNYRLLNCYAAPGSRQSLRPLYTVSVHPTTLDVPIQEGEFEALLGPPLASQPIEETSPDGVVSTTQWVAQPNQRYMDCRKVTTVEAVRAPDTKFTCTRFLRVRGWVIGLGLVDTHSEAVQASLPKALEAWAAQVAAANRAK